MRLLIQDPDNENTDYLLESLLQASEESTEGGAAFSFASALGATMLLKDPVFQAFAANAQFDLVIGVDAITNTAALQAIHEAVGAFGGVTTRVFLHDRPTAIFHPKFCWFSKDDGGTAIVGSGNLTMGGLRSNWEAYSLQELNEQSVGDFKQTWGTWIDHHHGTLRSLDDPQVVERAANNTEWARLGEHRPRREADRDGGPHDEPSNENELEAVQPANEVLVAEIPRGGDRWHQANFDVNSYEGFFGARRGTQRRMFFQHISPAGDLGELEIRPSIAVASHNYRFEIGAAAGLPYPNDGPPIGVFVRVAVRTFRYVLLMPDLPGYQEATAVLNRLWNGPDREMRRVRLTAQALAAEWPDSPLI